jgi:endogenous inhibitor of DNA gyrase (YacG/DUF329 family)
MITSAPTPASRPARCPICGKPAAAPHRPFCSARCRSIDLGRWLKDSYKVETDEGPEDGTAEER